MPPVATEYDLFCRIGVCVWDRLGSQCGVLVSQRSMSILARSVGGLGGGGGTSE